MLAVLLQPVLTAVALAYFHSLRDSPDLSSSKNSSFIFNFYSVAIYLACINMLCI